MTETKKLPTRGPGKKPTLVGTSIRLPKDVLDFFNEHYPYTKQAMMREVLVKFINEQKGTTK